MKLNPKDVERAMKQMGLRSEAVDAEEVIIRTKDKDLIVTNPDVQKITMGGQQSFQITGVVQERSRDVTPEDVKLVAEQTGVSETTARKALETTKGDIAQAILELRSEPDE